MSLVAQVETFARDVQLAANLRHVPRNLPLELFFEFLVRDCERNALGYGFFVQESL